MGLQLPFELISNIASMGLIFLLFYKYLQYKKNLDVIKGLDEIKDNNSFTTEDINFIKSNEREYKEKVLKVENNVRLATPVFIIIAGLLVLMFSFQDALIHLNVVVVAYIFMQVDRIHKKNLYSFLYELKKSVKDQEKNEEQKEESN